MKSSHPGAFTSPFTSPVFHLYAQNVPFYKMHVCQPADRGLCQGLFSPAVCFVLLFCLSTLAFIHWFRRSH